MTPEKHFTFNKNRDLLMSPAKSITLQPSHQVDLQAQMHTRQFLTEKIIII